MKTKNFISPFGLLLAMGAASAVLTSCGKDASKPAPFAEPEMVTVAGGTFTMGATTEQGEDYFDEELPTHEVTLSSYAIGKYEVTQKLWQDIMGSNPSYFKGDDLPVESVGWDDIQDFLVKLNRKTGKTYRLPTEAEWEYAARGGNKSQNYKYSGSNTPDDVAWYGDSSGRKIHPVGTKAANELGIHDMSGNVWEWCSDWYGNYRADPQTNPTGVASGSRHVLRGGRWAYAATYCRVSFRYYYTPGYRYTIVGFRLVLPLEVIPTS